YKGDSSLEIDNIKAYETPEYIEDTFLKNGSYAFDFIFLTTKTYDIEIAMEQYKKLINASKKLVILQNGIGNEDLVKNYCDKAKIIRIVTTHGALFKKKGCVIHTGEGIIKLGNPFLTGLSLGDIDLEQAQTDLFLLNELINLSGLESTISDDIIKDCWEKIFVNVGINAFGALTRLPNGKLLENEGIKLLMSEAVKEAVKIAELKEVNLSQKDYIDLMYKVAKNTSENKNSMLQDVLKAKRTEIDYINGRIVKYAKKFGVNVPINEFLTYLIKGLEQSLN
ncbi:MAG: ketopantoate reductase family protein, partial [Promethearchaeota archaeon]